MTDPTLAPKLRGILKRLYRLTADVEAILSGAERAPDAAALVRARRAELGISQAALAARLGVDKVSVYRWEAGKTIPSPESLNALLALDE